MKSIVFGLSLVGAAVAQYASDAGASDGGASASTYSAASYSGSYPVASTPSPTTYDPVLYPGSDAPWSAPTAAPTDFYQYMPYSAYQSGGYKSLDCGYGYSKQDDGSCTQDSWVDLF